MKTASEKFRELSVQIKQQLRANGIIDHKGRNTGRRIEDSNSEEWIAWINELMAIQKNQLLLIDDNDLTAAGRKMKAA